MPFFSSAKRLGIFGGKFTDNSVVNNYHGGQSGEIDLIVSPIGVLWRFI
jgi:hypothetical protein